MSICLIILYCSEAIAALFGLLYFSKVKGTTFQWFSIYLVLIFLLDFIGNFIENSKVEQTYNVLYYNYLVIPVEFSFFFWLFYKISDTISNKRLSIILMGIYLVSLLIDFLYFSKHKFFFESISYSIGNLLLLILIISFFIELTNSEAILNYRQNRMFWIGIGLMIFYLGSLPYYGLRNTLAINYHKLNIIYTDVSDILDSIMYLMFALSFIWGRPNSQSSYSSSA